MSSVTLYCDLNYLEKTKLLLKRDLLRLIQNADFLVPNVHWFGVTAC